MTMTLVQSVTLGTAGLISFTAIPQGATDLMLLLSMRGVSTTDCSIQFNTATTGLYRTRVLIGTGSGILNANTTASDQLQLRRVMNDQTATANTFSNVKLYIPNYAGNRTKSVCVESVNENNATAASQTLTTGHFDSTAAITSISFLFNNAAVNSTASLYTITKA